MVAIAADLRWTSANLLLLNVPPPSDAGAVSPLRPAAVVVILPLRAADAVTLHLPGGAAVILLRRVAVAAAHPRYLVVGADAADDEPRV